MKKFQELWIGLNRLDRGALFVFTTMLLTFTLANMDHSFFGYAVPGIIKEFDTGIDTIGYILTISFIFAAFTNLAMGLLADKYGRKTIIVFCLASSAAFIGLHTFANSILTLGILRAFGFALSNAVQPIASSYIAEASPPRIRGLMVGLFACGFPMGAFIAGMISVPLLSYYGWRSIFLIAFLVIPIAFIIGKFLPESQSFIDIKNNNQKEETSWKEKIKELFGKKYRRKCILCMLAFFCFGGPYAGTAFFFPTFFNEVRGYSDSEAAAIIGLAYGIGIIGYISSAVVGEFFLTRRNTTIIWCWLGTLSLLCLIWIPDTIAEDIFWFGLMSMFFYGMGSVITAMIIELFPTRLRATGAALAGTFGLNLGFAIYPILVSKTVSIYGWQWAFTITVVPTLFLSGVILLGIENRASGLKLEDD